MKKTVLSLSISLFLTFSSFAQNPLGGTISKDTTIATDIVINKELTVNEGVHLTILPGVTIQTMSDLNIIVKGSIIAKGTASKPIVFTKQLVGWAGINLQKGTSIPDSSIFEYCTFRDVRSWGWSRGVFTIENNNKVAFRHCLFTENVYGRVIYLDHSNIKIENSSIIKNESSLFSIQDGGIGIAIYNSNPIIINTILKNNKAINSKYTIKGSGVFSKNSAAKFINCDISHNEANISNVNDANTIDGAGMYSYNSKDSLINCRIVGNIASTDYYNKYNSIFGIGFYSENSTEYIENCVVDSNNTKATINSTGAGLYIMNGKSQMINCKVRANSCINAAGMVFDSDTSKVTNCEFSNNVASGNGGGIMFSYSTVQLQNNRITNNTALIGGGIYIQSRATRGNTPEDIYPSISNSSVVNNSSTKSGGAIWISDDVNVLFNNLTFSNNKPDISNYGEIVSRDTSFSGKVSFLKSLYVGNGRTLTIAAGSILEAADSTLLFIKGRLIAKGTAKDSILFINKGIKTPWRGIYFYRIHSKLDSSYLSYCRVSGGLKDRGGALYIEGKGKIQPNNCIFSNSKSYDAGGGVALLSANTTLINCRIINNSNEYINSSSNRSANAAGLYIGWSKARVINCEIANNYIPMKGQSNEVRYGQGIFIDSSSVVIDRCKIIKNGQDLSVHQGGGFYIYRSKLTCINTLIADNRAAVGSSFYTMDSKTTFINTTFTNNNNNNNVFYISSSEYYKDSISFINTLVNHPIILLPKSCYITAKNSLFSKDTVYSKGNGNIASDPAMIDQTNGDYRIANLSPCINKGTTDNAPTIDITGRTRTGLPDIGAYEWDGTIVTNQQKITGIQLNVHKLNLEISKQYQLTVTVNPDNAINKEYIFTLSNKMGVVSISSTGLVQGNAVGTVTVTAVSVANPLIKDSCIVTVTKVTTENTTENSIVDQNEEIRIYPNPAKDVVTVEVASFAVKHLALYSITGELLEKKENSNNLYLGDRNKGMYFIEVTTEQGTIVKKIIKQ